MAIRNILRESDPFLHKTCRPVEAFDERLAQLLDDMAETLHKADGVGLAVYNRMLKAAGHDLRQTEEEEA